MYSLIEQTKIKKDILNLIEQGLSVNEICKREDFIDDNTFYQWLNKDAQFKDNYIRARENQALFYSEKIQKTLSNLPEEPTREQLDKARLIIDSDKWIASKLLPKVYGTINNQTNVQVNIQPVTGMNIINDSE